MIGSINVQQPDEFERWLAGGAPGESMEAAGAKVFQASGCSTCHTPDGAGLGPSLLGVYGNPAQPTTGELSLCGRCLSARIHPAASKAKLFSVISHHALISGQLTEEQLNNVGCLSSRAG